MTTVMLGKFLVSVACINCALAVTYLWGQSEKMNAQCPDDEAFPSVALPDDDCDLRSYIMCNHGKAEAIEKCPLNRRFNKEKGWCDFKDKVPLPIDCQDIEAFTTAPTCADGVTYIGVPSTCRKYIWCLPYGGQEEMDCPEFSYFIPELQGCKYAIIPFIRLIPQDTLKECLDKDPWNSTTTVEP